MGAGVGGEKPPGVGRVWRKEKAPVNMVARYIILLAVLIYRLAHLAPSQRGDSISNSSGWSLKRQKDREEREGQGKERKIGKRSLKATDKGTDAEKD